MKPKHKKSHFYSTKGLFTNLSNFADLESRISALPDHERGSAFEVFAEAYFKTQALHQAQEIWPDSEIPQSIRHELGLPPTDMGIDGVFKTHDGKYHAYQVKYRTNRLALTWDELSTFMGLSDRSDKRVLFTNSNDISSVMDARTVFYSIKGNDLDRLDRSDFHAIENWLKSGFVIKEKKSPRPHQADAIDAIVKELDVNDRATAIMACGTGKTLVALWVAEKKDAQTILVLLPSLALVRQTLHDWAKENRWDNFNYLCICSDVTVIKGEDEIILNQHELDFPVTTQKDVVEQFLQNQKFSRKIIFSTYQSCKIIPKGFSFDLGVFDEAHKTAGREGTNFAYALKDENISIAKRLFLTATPRHYDIKKKDKEGDLRLVFSMDDTKVYGQICHKLSFADAAKQEIICKYKVVISLVVSEEVDRELLKRGEVIIKGDPIKAQRVANLLALTHAVERYGVKRVFTFHNSVKAAQSFTADSSEGISTFLKDFRTFHVNGEMPTSKRELIMLEFKEAPKAVMSNARCLTEGVDVPAVDMVAFISPKKSQIDIVQATGRAMRKSEGKEYGYILIPIFLELASGENIEQALDKTQFDDIWNVLQTLQEHDESLFEVISQMREEIGRTGGFDDSRLREKLEFLGPEVQLSVLHNAITTKIIEQLGSTWDERFGELCKFKEANGHCNIPQDYTENPLLGRWVGTQRKEYKKEKLLQYRIEKLNGQGFCWGPKKTLWEKNFLALCIFKKTYGNCNVPAIYSKNPSLGLWVSSQRSEFQKNKLSQKRINRLCEIGFIWARHDAIWETQFTALCNFKEISGHCNVPEGYPENPSLARWVQTQRYLHKIQSKRLTTNRINRLNEVGLIWNPIESLWDKNFTELCRFKGINGHCNVPQNYPENSSLAGWVCSNRNLYQKKSKRLTSDRIDKLNKIGFIWKPLEAEWEEKFSKLLIFREKNGHCQVPQNDIDHAELATWVGSQRKAYKDKKLYKNRIARLNSIGFDWDPLNTLWKETFMSLCRFKDVNGHCNVPKKYPEDPSLSMWVRTQRHLYRTKSHRLSSERIKKLNKIGFLWNSKTQNNIKNV